MLEVALSPRCLSRRRCGGGDLVNSRFRERDSDRAGEGDIRLRRGGGLRLSRPPRRGGERLRGGEERRRGGGE